jgi:nucleoside-diphosphate-sugar epimerase
LYEADNARLKRRVYCIAGFSPTAKGIYDEVKRVLPNADINFKPNREMTEIVRSWPKYLKETRASEDWGWKTKYLLKETVEDFIKEVQSHPEIYG